MVSFQFIDDITRADIAFRAYGKDLSDLFKASVKALMAILLQNPDKIENTKTVKFSLNQGSLDLLYYDFLQEFIYYKDTKMLLLMPENITIEETEAGYTCESICSGEQINRDKHQFKIDIKAITMHNLNIKREKNQWISTVVVDV